MLQIQATLLRHTVNREWLGHVGYGMKILTPKLGDTNVFVTYAPFGRSFGMVIPLRIDEGWPEIMKMILTDMRVLADQEKAESLRV